MTLYLPITCETIRVRIGFSTTSGPLSRLIRWAMRSQCSHTFFVIADPVFRCDMVLEAHEMGMRMVPWEEWVVDQQVVEILPSPCDVLLGLQTTKKFVGRRYDFTGLVGMGVVLLGRRFSKRWKNPLRNSWSVFCSEFVVRTLQAANYTPVLQLDPETVSPEDLLLILKNNQEPSA